MLAVDAFAGLYSFMIENKLSLLGESKLSQQVLLIGALMGQVGDKHLLIFTCDCVL